MHATLFHPPHHSHSRPNNLPLNLLRLPLRRPSRRTGSIHHALHPRRQLPAHLGHHILEEIIADAAARHGGAVVREDCAHFPAVGDGGDGVGLGGVGRGGAGDAHLGCGCGGCGVGFEVGGDEEVEVVFWVLLAQCHSHTA